MKAKTGQAAAALVTLLWGFSAALASGAKPPETGFRSGFVTISGSVKIHYLEAGPRDPGRHEPAMLFVPGWTMPAEIWEPQIRHFSRTHRVVAMDPRSQGESTETREGNYPEVRAQDIKAVVDQLKLGPVVLVGWSLGVDELAAYVEQFGCENLAALVFVDGIVRSLDDWDKATQKGFFNFLFRFLENRPEAGARFVRGMYARPQSPAYLERITRASLRTPTPTAMALMVGMVAKDRRAALGRITRPALIVAAEGPHRGLYEDMQRLIPGARLKIMPGVGHALFVDDAPGFNALLDEFLRSVPPSAK